MKTHLRLRVYIGHMLFMANTFDGFSIIKCRGSWELGASLEVFQPAIGRDGVTRVG
jgi:hypothetical protein